MTHRTTRAERMANPTVREAIRYVAENHGACLRPIQLRRTRTETGEIDHVLIPCGATLASICPPCAERAKTLRSQQCREGWHLEDEPIPTAPPPDEVQQAWAELRAQAQADRDHAKQSGEGTAEGDKLIAELDHMMKQSGLRGRADPQASRPRRHRSTRRRQDAPDLPRRKIGPRTIGKTYTAPDGKTFRPSMFLTLTCPSYGKVGQDGTPVDPRSYDYQRAARNALHFAALFDRFIQNLRRYTGYDLQYFAAIEPSAASPRTSTSPSAAPSPGTSSVRSSPPPTTRSGGPSQTSSTTAGTCRSGMSTLGPSSTRTPARSCQLGTGPSTPSAAMTSRGTWPGSVPGSTPKACWPDPGMPVGASATSPST
jgi:hypothetical protein